MDANSLSILQPDSDQERVEIRHGFHLDGHPLLVAKGTYSELIRRPSICPIPGTPAGFTGFINRRGEAVPVFHLPQMFDAHQVADEQWILILDRGERAVGLLIEDLPRGLSDLEPVDKADSSINGPIGKFSLQAFKHQQQIWREFDHRAFGDFVKHWFRTPQPGG